MNEYRLPPPATDADPLIHKSEISLCRVYKRSGIDDGQPSSSNHTSSARRTAARAGRHGSSPSSSTTLSPTQQPSSFLLLQGEYSSSPLAAAIMDQQMAITTHNAPSQLLPPLRPRAYTPSATNSIAAVAPQPTEGAVVLASTYSLLNMAAAAPMDGSRPVDELSTLVGHSQGYANLSAPTGSHFPPLPSPQPMPQVAPHGVLPVAPPLMSSASDKLSWDWNPVPDTTARDYDASGFK
uniref:NAC domain-containing protein n=1 Tax=Arundo donax TaxID=35708 RepID=A0A0A9E310_ARUDO